MTSLIVIASIAAAGVTQLIAIAVMGWRGYLTIAAIWLTSLAIVLFVPGWVTALALVFALGAWFGWHTRDSTTRD